MLRLKLIHVSEWGGASFWWNGCINPAEFVSLAVLVFENMFYSYQFDIYSYLGERN